jgi:hypothetical protein
MLIEEIDQIAQYSRVASPVHTSLSRSAAKLVLSGINCLHVVQNPVLAVRANNKCYLVITAPQSEKYDRGPFCYRFQEKDA